jgi:hypothetical protein
MWHSVPDCYPIDYTVAVEKNCAVGGLRLFHLSPTISNSARETGTPVAGGGDTGWS